MAEDGAFPRNPKAPGVGAVPTSVLLRAGDFVSQVWRLEIQHGAVPSLQSLLRACDCHMAEKRSGN